MSDNFEMTDSLNITIYHPLYYYFPQQIEALRKLKSELGYAQSNAVNLLFIPAYTSFLESVLAELFDNYLRQQKEVADGLQSRLIEHLENILHKATWKNYNENFETVFGYRLNTIIRKDTMEAIVSLFQFRNQVIHGKQIVHSIENAGEGNELSFFEAHYKSVNAFFLAKNLVTQSELAAVNFINDKIIDYYFQHVLVFVRSLFTQIMEPNQLFMLHTVRVHIFEKLSFPFDTESNDVTNY